MTLDHPPNLILAAGDWGYLVALLIFSLISWIANTVKKRQEEAAKKSGPPARKVEDSEEVEPAEVLGPEETPFPFPPPIPAPPIRRTARPVGPPPRETRVKQPRPRVIIAESPMPRVSDLETPIVLPIARAADIKPLAREEDMLDAFSRPSRAAVQEKLGALPPLGEPAATPQSTTLALLRQLRTLGSPFPRQAILLSEVLAPPLALRHQTPGLPPLNDV